MKRLTLFLKIATAAWGASIQLFAADGNVRWTYATGDVVFGAPATDSKGNLYFGSSDGYFYSLTSNGTTRWQFTGAVDWIESSPALSADETTAYFGSWDNFVYAVNTTTGAEKWRYETGGILIASPAVGSDGTVYIGSADGIFYALRDNGQEKWVFVADGEIESSAVVDSQNRVTFATTTGSVYNLDAKGNLQWTFQAGSVADNGAIEHGVYAALALDGADRIYVGSKNHYLIVLEADGRLAWTYQSTDRIDSSPVIDKDGNVYFAARDGYLTALDSYGSLQWELLVGDVFYASPAIDTNGTLYVPSYAGNSQTIVQAISSAGHVLWSQILPGYNDASVTIGQDGAILIGSYSGLLYALESSATLADSGWPKFGRNARQSHAIFRGDSRVFTAFPGVGYSSYDWYQLNWLANGWFYAGYFPWINHLEHGWWWCGYASWNAIWLWDVKLGWLYATPSIPNYFYSYTHGTWLMHLVGSTVYPAEGKKAIRWFYAFPTAKSEGGWISVTP